MPKKKRYVFKDAATGKFVSFLYFLRHPITTYRERVR